MPVRGRIYICLAAVAMVIFPTAVGMTVTSVTGHAKKTGIRSPAAPERDLGFVTQGKVEKPRYPIVIPPASKLRSLLRKQRLLKSSSAKQASHAAPVVPPVMLLPLGSTINLGADECNRAIPTRQEFLDMLRSNPADANQIMRSCAINPRSISPLRQLPVGRRQLPEDTRQRPVGTWGR
jgi:hypothetical protein